LLGSLFINHYFVILNFDYFLALPFRFRNTRLLSFLLLARRCLLFPFVFVLRVIISLSQAFPHWVHVGCIR